jgi:uncharacterized membrane protein
MILELITLLIIMLALDSVYLFFTKELFGQMVAKIQRTSMQVRLLGAAVVYFLLAIGIYYFIIKPRRSVWEAGFLGLVIYGTFDFTNYAMLKNYDIAIGLMDTMWGGILFAATTFIYFKVL